MTAQESTKQTRNPFQQAHDAVVARDVQTAEKLFIAHPKVLADEDGDWMITAAETGSVDMVKLLVRLGLEVNTGSNDYPTPLWSALSNNKDAVAVWLLDNGANPSEYHVLGTAARHGNLKMAKLLLERGADLHATWGPDGKSFNALAMAELYGHTEVAKYLREQGAVEPGKPVPKKGPKKVGDASGVASPTSRKSSSRDEVIAHLTKHLGKVDPLVQEQLVPGDVPIAIHLAKPTKERPHITLFTTGMSEKAMTSPKGETGFRYAELLLHLPADWPITAEKLKKPENSWPFHWMRKIASYPHAHDTWLGGRYTIISNDDPPKPLSPSVSFTGLLCASRMNAYSQLKTSDGRDIEFYTVTPIFTDERELEKQEGVFALFRAFDSKGIGEVLDIHRPNAAK